MKLENLERASELNEKLKLVERFIIDAGESIICIGSERTDQFEDIEDRLTKVVSSELKKIKSETLEEIRKL